MTDKVVAKRWRGIIFESNDLGTWVAEVKHRGKTISLAAWQQFNGNWLGSIEHNDAYADGGGKTFASALDSASAEISKCIRSIDSEIKDYLAEIRELKEERKNFERMLKFAGPKRG